MEKFKKYLILSQIVAENKAQFYVNWVSKFYFACKKDPTATVFGQFKSYWGIPAYGQPWSIHTWRGKILWV
jgi:hypothetical protein